jgi:transcriptional regulator with XRE-family HTH domain
MDIRKRVADERRMRGLSGRAAASLGGIANTTWSGFEAGGQLTDGVRRAVAKAFDWHMDWPENPPAEFTQLDGDVLRRMEEQLRAEIAEGDERVDARVRALERSLHDQLGAMVAQLEGLASRLEQARRESE